MYIPLLNPKMTKHQQNMVCSDTWYSKRETGPWRAATAKDVVGRIGILSDLSIIGFNAACTISYYLHVFLLFTNLHALAWSWIVIHGFVCQSLSDLRIVGLNQFVLKHVLTWNGHGLCAIYMSFWQWHIYMTWHGHGMDCITRACTPIATNMHAYLK